MRSVDPGVLAHSYCFSFTPSETARRLYYYPTWCGHYYCTPEYYMKREFFPDILLAYVRKGEFYLEYMDQQYTVSKGEVFFIDCQRPHFYQASKDLEFLYIHINGVNAHELAGHIIAQHGVLFQGETNVAIGKLLYNLIDQCRHDQIIAAPDFSLLCYQLLVMLTHRDAPENDIENPIDISIRYIRENVGSKITLDELADAVGLSKYHFSHLFKTETGYSPMEYVISTRLDRSRVLLKASHLSISEIAYEVGYENPGSFINLFTKKIGCSPKSFRKM